ncbi:glycosyltransferase involved in cell wall biosynthesis [Flavobacterium sp. 103]|uniref:glycosyltransferase n=1 Tax=Flavobacterium sp. 103 TaxID=2135624 RepID=UPI000D5C5C3F|nr:glycosyltransferase [Flavobacterium sp. 103]PVX47011.1 glycosyltransferase involved in cell wall biosynthesis [Flavobacterium sp. 103]
MDRKKILFVAPTLKAGGAERITAFLAQNINTTLFEVKLIVIGFEKDAIYDIQNIETHFLNKSRYLKAIPLLLQMIKREKPHIVFSSSGHINITLGLFSLFFSKIKFIVRETNIVSVVNGFPQEKNRLLFFLMQQLYPYLDVIICQSHDMKTDLVQKLTINPSKIIVINNPIINEIQTVKPKNKSGTIRFITVGRMSWIKGHLRILKILSQLKYDFQYTIIGTGLENECQIIQEEVLRLKLEEKVHFIPFTSNILSEMQQHDFFLQGSYVEGFPNALLESCSVGTPVLAFEAPGGTREIIQNGINGYLAKNETEMLSILNNLELIQKIKAEDVIQSVSKKFDKSSILNQYETLFLSA